MNEDDLKGEKNSKKNSCIVNQFHGNCYAKTPSFKKIKPVFSDVKRCFNAS